MNDTTNQHETASDEAESPSSILLRKLEREIAYSAARSDIELHCQHRPEYVKGQTSCTNWYAAGKGTYPAPLRFEIERSLRYLDLRGLLVRHPKHQNRVRVLDDQP